MATQMPFYTISPSLIELPKGKLARIKQYIRIMKNSFWMHMVNKYSRTKIKLADHAILEAYGVLSGKDIEIASAFQTYGIRNWGYVNDPLGYEWFVNPLVLIRGQGYPRFGDCDDQALAMSLMLACAGLEPVFIFLAQREIFTFNHVLCGFRRRNGAIIPLETIEKTGKYYPFKYPRHLARITFSPYQDGVAIYIVSPFFARALHIPQVSEIRL